MALETSHQMWQDRDAVLALSGLDRLRRDVQLVSNMSHQEAASSLTVGIQRFVDANDQKSVEAFSCVNGVGGNTATGKDKFISWLLGLDISNSGNRVTTKMREKIKKSHDPTVSELVVTVSASDHPTFTGTLAEATEHRRRIHAALNNFEVDKCLSVDIRDPQPGTPNITMENFPGFISGMSAEGQDLFGQLDNLVETIAQNRVGSLFVVRKLGDCVGNECWQHLRVIKDAQARVKRGEQFYLPLQICFIHTHGDAMVIPADKKTYAEFEDYFFGEVRKIVPNAPCFIVSNWKEDTPDTMDIGMKQCALELQERVDHLVRQVEGFGDKDVVAKERLLSSIGNDRLRALFWGNAAAQAARPLKKLAQSLSTGLTTLALSAHQDANTVADYTAINFGELLQSFGTEFVGMKNTLVYGRVLPDGCAPTLLTATDEYALYTGNFGDLEDWNEVITAEQDAFLNLTPQFALHVLLERFFLNFWTYFDGALMPTLDMTLINAMLERHVHANQYSRSSVFFQHFSASLAALHKAWLDIVPKFIATLCHWTATEAKRHALRKDTLRPLAERNDLTKQLDGMLRRVYLTDLKIYLEDLIAEEAKRPVEVDTDLERTLDRVLEREEEEIKEDSVLGRTESALNTAVVLDAAHFEKIQDELNDQFRTQWRMRMHDLQTRIVPTALRRFNFMTAISDQAESNWLFKQTALEVLGIRGVCEAISPNFPSELVLGTRSVLPARISEVTEVRKLGFTGLVPTWSLHTPDVLYPHYFECLLFQPHVKVCEALNERLKDCQGARSMIFQRLVQTLDQAKNLVGALNAIRGYFKQKTKEGAVFEERRVSDALLLLHSQRQRLDDLRATLPVPQAAAWASPIEPQEPELDDLLSTFLQ